MNGAMVAGGSVMMILAGFALVAPIFDGYSILDLGDICRTVQPMAGFLGIFGMDAGITEDCGEVHLVTLAIYVFGGIGLVILVVGAVVRR